MRPRLFLLLALLPTLLVPSLAQRRDLKLSPPEPVTRVLPDTIRIQAADRYGDLALVVWGSNRRLSDGTHVTCLWAALTRDSMQVGAPFLIHPDNARPARLVDVSAQRDRFVVAWMDSRADAPGIYAAVVDTTGLIVRPVLRVAATTGAELLRTFASGSAEHVLVWTSSGRTLAQRLTASGSPLGVVDTLGTRITWLRRMTRAIDGWILHVDNSRRFAIGRRISGIRPVVAPVCEPYVVRDDGAVVTVCNDTVRVFTSLFESTAMRERPVPMVDSLRLILAIPAIAGDSIMVLGLTRRDGITSYLERLHRVRLDDDLARAHDTVLLSMYTEYDRENVREIRGAPIVRIRGCENTYRFDAMLLFTVSGYHQRDETYEAMTRYVLDGSGSARAGGDSTVTACEAVTLRRTRFDSLSTISSAGLELSVATAVTTWNQPQRYPGIILSGDAVCLFWQQNGETPYVLSQWPDRSDTVTTPTDSMLPPRIPRLASYEIYYSAIETLHQSFGMFAILSDHFRQDEDRQGGVRFTANHAYLTCHRATVTGWRRIVLGQEKNWTRDLYFGPSEISHDPITGVATGGFTRSNVQTPPVQAMFVVYSIDTNGTLIDSIWRFRDIQPGRRVLADGPGRYLLCDAEVITHFRRDSSYVVTRFERVVTGASFQRLRDRRILRWWRDSLDRRRVYIERYEPGGAASGRSEFMLGAAAGELVLAESSDGTLLFVHADNSINVHRVALDLTPMGAPMRLTEPGAIARQPSAVVFRDTLIVVWEDWRNAGVDIYGTTVAVADVRSHVSPERTTAPRLLDRVSPMPARDMLEVSLAVPLLETTRLELVDASGAIRDRGSIEPGRMSVRMELDGCASGVYMLVARAGESVESSRVIVVR